MDRDPFTGAQIKFDRTCSDFYPPAPSAWKTYVLGGLYFATIVGGFIVVTLLVLF